MPLIFHQVTFTYEGLSSLLLENINIHFPRVWTGIVGPNGTGKTTVLRLAAGELQPLRGSVKRPAHVVFCPQRTDDPPAELPQFMASSDAEACTLRGKLAIGNDWAQRWQTLSHGERKRVQIAVALWQQPDLLLVDEPTNHIDLAARTLLEAALATFAGIGLVVSHDRALLDRLCRHCLFLEPPHATMRPGNYSDSSAEARREEASRVSERKVLKQQFEKLAEVSRKRYAEAAQADARNTKRGLARRDSDGRGRINLARVLGKDGQAGRLANQLEGRLAQAGERLDALRVKKTFAASFWLEGSVSPRQWLFTVPGATIDLDSSRRLYVPDLAMQRQDRIAITGANGAGKSTLVRHLLGLLTLPPDRIVYLPQEIDLATTRQIMRDVQRLSHDQLGIVMTVVSALGSRPERLLSNLEASPGELRKVLLALGVVRRPHLIVMDEPTNHLDLPAIESLEESLSDCPCGMLLVSHDLQFLSRVTQTRWHLQPEGERIVLEVFP